MKPLTRLCLALFVAVGLGCASVPAEDSASRKDSAGSADSAAGGSKENWPLFRGDAALSGVSQNSLPETLAPLWVFEADDAIEGAAAIYDGVVYVGSLDGTLHAINLANGQSIWKYVAEAPIKASVTYARGKIYVGDEDGTLHVVNASDGKVAWTFATEGEIVSSANVVEEYVLFGSYDGFLYNLDLDGKLRWKVETDGYVYGTPAYSDGAVISAGCDGRLRTVDVKTGEITSLVELGGYVGASPAVRGSRAFMGNFENQVIGVDLDAKKILWSYENPDRQFPYLSSAALTEDLVILGGRDKFVHGIDAATGKIRWKVRMKGRVDSSPVIVGDRFYVGSTTGELVALSVKDGAEQWRFDSGAGILAAPSIAEQRLVIGTTDGQLFCFGAK